MTIKKLNPMLPQNKIQNLPKIGITQGDINGIGYEVILKVLSDSRMMESFIPVIYGQSRVFSYYKKNFGFEDLTYNVIRDASQAQPKRINIINHTDEELKIEPGMSTQVAGKASVAALKMAMNDLRGGAIDAMVNAPVNKANIQSESFKFRGQTEYVSSFYQNCDELPVMVCGSLRIALATNHIPLKEVPDVLTRDLLIRKINVLNKTLLNDFNIIAPRIAVLSLNPHAGDNGLVGTEEADVIKPSLDVAKSHGTLVFGPFSSYSFFGTGAWRKYDAVLAMYHDQGSVPFKVLACDGGVSFTAGLPVVRTAPTHGTGYDIANRNIADPDSFRHAIFLALDVLRNRRREER